MLPVLQWLGYSLAAIIGLRALYVAVLRFWRRDGSEKPLVRYKDGSRVCEAIVRACSTLNERYATDDLQAV